MTENDDIRVPEKDPFEEYIKVRDPEKRELGYAWHTAIGLQSVDGLTTSEYLRETAQKNIEGELSLPKAQELSRPITVPTARMSPRAQRKPTLFLRG